MIDIILNPNYVLIGLCLAAVLTPAAAYGLHRAKPAEVGKRLALVLGALGPFALVYWFFHNAVLAVVGFDSVFSVMIVLGVAGVLGWVAGRFATA